MYEMYEMYESRQMFQSPEICCVMGPVIGYAVRAHLRWYLSPKGGEGDLARPGNLKPFPCVVVLSLTPGFEQDLA